MTGWPAGDARAPRHFFSQAVTRWAGLLVAPRPVAAVFLFRGSDEGIQRAHIRDLPGASLAYVWTAPAMRYHPLSAIEVKVLEAVFERQQQAFAPIDLPGVDSERVAVTVCRLMHRGLIEATSDGVPGDVTEEGRDWMRDRIRNWMRNYGRTRSA